MPHSSRSPRDSRIGSGPDDLVAAEIEGLDWLQNSPGISQFCIDERGYPVRMFASDPRAYAGHKDWLSRRTDRDVGRRRRDRTQAEAVTKMILTYRPDLQFDEDALEAFPQEIREAGKTLVASVASRLSSQIEQWL